MQGQASDDNVRSVMEARRKIDEAFAVSALFGRTREEALYHYCAVLDVEAYKAGARQAQLFSAGRSAVESSIKAIPAIFANCQSGRADARINPVIFSEAHEFFVFSRDYEQVQYSFALAEKGQFEVQSAPGTRRIVFSYVSSDSDRIDTLRRSGELMERSGLGQPAADDAVLMGPVVAEVQSTLERLIRFTAVDCISFEYNAELCGGLAKWGTLLENSISWELDDSVRFGTLSFAQVKRFWGALLAMANTHDFAHLIASRGDPNSYPIGSRVAAYPLIEWTTVLSKVSGLSTSCIASLLVWLTFDPVISSKTPMLQPFLALPNDRLCVPSLFLVTNNFERNFLKLINRHPKLLKYSNVVNNAKEPLALRQLSLLFPSPSFETKTQVLLPETDADLVAYERASGWTMVLQHKWLIGPDTASESASNDDELSKGVRQALLAREYWRSNPDHLRKELNLASDQSITRIEALVVCRGAESTGFLLATEAPVLTETAFKSLLKESSGLPGLWDQISARPDFSAAASRTEDVAYLVELAGYEFVMPGLAMPAR